MSVRPADTTELPILYSFRRCPYAMRARVALNYTGTQVALREVILKHKPQSLIDASPKATVPVLVLADGTVIDESLDIMRWALRQADPDGWLFQTNSTQRHQSETLIATNDSEFKQALDRYKYADRHPEQPVEAYRAEGEVFLQALESALAEHRHLVRDTLSIADIAIFPFIRQFAHVDKHWFDQTDYPKLQQWLEALLTAPLFTDVMQKYPAWQAGDPVTVFPPIGN